MAEAVAPQALLDLVAQVCRELHPRSDGRPRVTLDSSLERDLGLDSLGRVELLMRIERTFGVGLPDQVLARAETPRDLLQAILRAEAGSTASAALEVPEEVEVREAAGAPEEARTLLEALEWHVDGHPEQTHITFYTEEEGRERLTYGALQTRSLEFGAGLQERGLEPGQTVALMLPTCLEYFYAFLGILLSGGIPVPLYPPFRLSQIEDHLRRQAGILRNSLARFLVTSPEVKPLARFLHGHVKELERVLTVEELAIPEGRPVTPALRGEDVAFLQYTSGSTGNPKGVVLTHQNLLTNLRSMGSVAGAGSRDTLVSWLPLYHDMGLIGAWMGSLYYACHLILMSPLAFLSRPVRWFQAIHRHQGTISAGPNFAYELCLRKIPEEDLEGLDLSSWRLAMNGAEPVSPRTIQEFTRRFAPYGLRPEAVTPVYGLAENTLGVAFPPPGRGPVIDRIQRHPFLRTGRAVPTDPDDETALAFVGCGPPIPGHQVRVVDAAGKELPERQEGRLQVQGPSATSGYYRNPRETRRLFRGDWLDTGDRAYVAGGEIYITGRVKDVIIRAGRNVYPQEVEEAVGNLPGIRRGCVAVFGCRDEASGTERLVVMAETRETDPASRERLREEIQAVTVDLTGLPPDEVLLVPPHTVLKTSSGKIRRSACREMYERGEVGQAQQAVWWQVARLGATALMGEVRRWARVGRDHAWGAYVWILFSLMAPLAWLGVAVTPGLGRRRRLLRRLARILLGAAGIPLRVSGLEHLAGEGPKILAVNHASYTDGIVVLAALPPEVSYVVKGELERSFLARVFVRRIGGEFVERWDPERGVEDTRRLVEAVKKGRSLVVFPEGTFGRAPGLLPFRLGAFVVAAETGVPVVPVTLRGTRTLLRSDQWLPRRSPVMVTVSSPVPPSGSDWSAAVRLRDAVRAEMLRHTGEPDLAAGGA